MILTNKIHVFKRVYHPIKTKTLTQTKIKPELKTDESFESPDAVTEIQPALDTIKQSPTVFRLLNLVWSE